MRLYTSSIQLWGLVLALGSLLGACNSGSKTTEVVETTPVEQRDTVASTPRSIAPPTVQSDRRVEPAQAPSLASRLRIQADDILASFAKQDLATVAAYVHPEAGLTFTPSVYIEAEDQTFTQTELEAMASQPTTQTYQWGIEEGTGNRLILPFKAYCEKYIYDVPFLETDSVYVDRFFQRGNKINNLKEAYPNCHFVEYYIPAVNPDYAGMDWRALRLVFQPYETEMRLRGVVHAAWTP